MDDVGRLWIAVRVPALPQNVTGWVPRSALGANSFVRTRLVVDLDGLSATLLRDGRPVFEAEIGVGAPAFPTPAASSTSAASSGASAPSTGRSHSARARTRRC